MDPPRRTRAAVRFSGAPGTSAGGVYHCYPWWSYATTPIRPARFRLRATSWIPTRNTEFSKTANEYKVKARAAAQVGPNIDEKALASQITGKRAGEVQQQLEDVQGVEDVNVSFSPFWVTKTPKNADKITIKFVVKND